MIKLKKIIRENQAAQNSINASKWDSYHEDMRHACGDYGYAKKRLATSLKSLGFDDVFIQQAVKYAMKRSLNGLTEKEYVRMLKLRNKAMGNGPLVNRANKMTRDESYELRALHDKYFRPKVKDMFSIPDEDMPDVGNN